MKNFTILLVLQLLFAVNTFADTFNIKGKISGKVIYNYAYLFNNERDLIENTNVIDQSFVFSGEINYKQRFGQLPLAVVLLSEEKLTVEEIKAKNLLSILQYNQCTVLLEQNIDVSYDSDRKVFSISGDRLNKVQNLYQKEFSTFRNKRDSILKITDKNRETKNLEVMKLLTKMAYNYIDIIKMHPDSEASLFSIGSVIYDQGLTADESLQAFNLISPSIRASEYGKHTYKDVADKIRNEQLIKKPIYTIGMKMPTFSISNEKGELIKSELQYAKYTLIDFWATWCIPCRKETPNIIKVFTDYNQKGFNVITVSIDEIKDKQKWIEVLKKDNMDNFVNLFNGADISGIARELKVVAIPANYLVDSKGTIIATNLRGDELAKQLQKLLP